MNHPQSYEIMHTSMTKLENTIVSAGDRNFLWGLFLLVSSIRKANMKEKIKILIHDFTEEEKSYLTQYSDIELITIENPSSCMTIDKPIAMLSATTPLITWLDGDTIVTGDVSNYLTTTRNQVQIRQRSPQENRLCFQKNLYTPGEWEAGAIPQKVLMEWQKDINENTTPALTSTVLANCMIFHESARNVIQQWHDLIKRVIPNSLASVIDYDSFAYTMTDESALNAVLCYAKDAPGISEYKLDKDGHAFLAHFSMSPKPWKRWLPQHFRYFDTVMEILSWVEHNGYKMPPRPWSLKNSNKLNIKIFLYFYSMIRNIKRALK